MNDHTIIYEINGDDIQYYDPNDPEIVPIPSPEPHYHPHLNPHSGPDINNNHNNEPHSLLNMNSMLGLYLFLSVTGIVSIGLYISRCIEEHRESIRIIRRNNRSRQRINVNSLNTLLLCDELPDDSCSICLEDFKTGDNIKKLNCTHIFHKECLEPWLNDNNRNCPMCRTDIL